MKLNLKKLSRRGYVGSILWMVVFFLIGCFFILLYFGTKNHNKTAEQLYEEGQIFGASEVVEYETPLAVKIYGISDEFEEEEEDVDDNGLYAIEHDYGYAFMYADKNDYHFYEMVTALQDGPVTVIVGAYEWEEEEKEIIDEINADSESSDVMLDRDSYLYFSSDQFDEDADNKMFFLIMVIGAFTIVFIILIALLIQTSKNRKAYKELLRQYPELENNDDLILASGYYDDKIKIAVYKNHVISVANKFMTIDLREIKSYNTFIENSYYSGIRTGQMYFINFIFKVNRSLKLPVKKYQNETERRLDDVYNVISKVLHTIYGEEVQIPKNESHFSGYKTPAQADRVAEESDANLTNHIQEYVGGDEPKKAENEKDLMSENTSFADASLPNGNFEEFETKDITNEFDEKYLDNNGNGEL